MSRRYSVAGRSGATNATAGHCAATLWNPSAGRVLSVHEIYMVSAGAVADNWALVVATARGTAGSTVTPTIINDFGNASVAPNSGAVLDLGAYSVQPTVGTLYIRRGNRPGALGVEFPIIFTRPFEIPPGEGLSIVVPSGLSVAIQATDFTFVWEE